jgi:predicted RNase H-like HicB family nuclease
MYRASQPLGVYSGTAVTPANERLLKNRKDIHKVTRYCGPTRLHAQTPGNSLLLMRTYTAVIERDPDTGVFVGYVPGFPGAHSQGNTLDELHANLREVIVTLLEDGEPPRETEFVGTQTILVA